MLSVTKLFEFEAAHHLPNHKGKCAFLHGHSYKLEIEISGKLIPEGEEQGMIVDFGILKKFVQLNIISIFDHCNLNTIFINPTAENMVLWIVNAMKDWCEDKLILNRIRLWETSSSYAEWTNK